MLVVSQPWNHFITISYAPFITGRPLVNPWFICKFQWNMDGKKIMVIIFQQQLLMHSHPVFWLNSYHVIASNTAKNLVSVIQIGKIAPTCWMPRVLTKRTPSITQNSTWRKSPTSRGTLSIFNSQTQIFWKITALKKFADLKMSKF